MKITPEQAREALDAWICRPGMTQEQATILITESFWALKERPNIDVQRVTDEGGAVDQRALGVNRVNRPGFPGECFICELRLPDHRFRWKHNKLFLLLPEEYGPAFPAIVDCYTSPPTLVWPVPLLHGFSSSYGVLPPLCKDH